VIISRQYYVNCTGYPSDSASSSKWHAWFASRCLGRRLCTWQMTAVLFLTVPNADCGQRTFRLAWCHPPHFFPGGEHRKNHNVRFSNSGLTFRKGRNVDNPDHTLCRVHSRVPYCVHDHVHGRVQAVYTVVYDVYTSTRPVHGRGHGRCTQPFIHGRYRPCTRRVQVYTTVYCTAVCGPCTLNNNYATG